MKITWRNGVAKFKIEIIENKGSQTSSKVEECSAVACQPSRCNEGNRSVIFIHHLNRSGFSNQNYQNETALYSDHLANETPLPSTNWE
jgi:hypothetical protein